MHSLCLVLVLAIALSGCSSGGDSAAPATTTTGGGTTSNPISLNLPLAAGDYWDFFWTSETSTFAQGSGTSSSVETGTFRVTIGAPVSLGGYTAYPISVTGDPGTNPDFSPRWTHITVDSNGSLLGTTDGANFEILYDATSQSWIGGGFFVEFNTSEAVNATTGTFVGEYNQTSAIKVSYASSSGGCETILGNTICSDTSTSYAESENYKDGVGPIGYALDIFYSSSGGNFFSSHSIERTVELIETSKTADDGYTFVKPPWEDVAAMSTEREDHAAVVLNGKIYVIGGRRDVGGNITTLTSMESYDPVTDQWTAEPPLPMTVYAPSAEVINGTIYVISSDSVVNIYTPGAGWSTGVTSLFDDPSFDTAVYDDASFGDVVVTFSSNVNPSSIDVWGYDISDNQWLSGASQSQNIRWSTLEIVDDIAYWVGGFYDRFSGTDEVVN
jgi:hypothetical protein